MNPLAEGAWQTWHSEDVPLLLGVSSCLLGESVRFDGGHARDRFVTDVLDRWVDWAPFCPEVEAGMGVPRPTVRLIARDGEECMIAPSSGEDFTSVMQTVSKDRVEALADIDGYVLKKASPSCGLSRLRVYRENGHGLHKNGVGLFARALTSRWPLLPVEEEGRLNDPLLRENFIERIFCRNRWRVLVHQGPSRRSLVAFHTAHKLLIRAHNETGYRRLGQIVASFGSRAEGEVFEAYETELQRALQTKASAKKHTNVLQHALGYLKDHLGPKDKHEILTAIEDYRTGLIPLVVPVTLLRFFIHRHDVEYLKGQLYFDPHPKELMLRNHV